MVKAARKKAARHDPSELRGWQQIAGFLGQPTAVVQRWAAQGMPVRRQGRYVTTTADELNEWLGRESGKPVHVATDSTDLTAELKRGISFLRRQHRGKAADNSRKTDRSAKRKSN
jgi:phage terminase Nu1 subunit (DNA packaging protein)